jgi:drug/metabolite transporter (DMT)-like permease
VENGATIIKRPESEKLPLAPYPAIGLGVLAVSFASVLIKMTAAPPLAVAVYRMGFTLLVILPATILIARRDISRLRQEDLLCSAGSGFFLALHFATWITSLRYTSVASSTVLVTTQPLFVVAGSALFFRERLSRRAFGGVLLAFAGSGLVGFSDFRIGGAALWGDLLALLGALTFAAYLLMGRRLRQRLPLLPYTTLVYGTCTAVLVGFCLAAKVPLAPYSRSELLIFAALALLATVFGHTVFNWAVKYVPAPVVAVSILGEPVAATGLAYLFLRESPGLLQLIGGLIILAGISVFVGAKPG